MGFQLFQVAATAIDSDDDQPTALGFDSDDDNIYVAPEPPNRGSVKPLKKSYTDPVVHSLKSKLPADEIPVNRRHSKTKRERLSRSSTSEAVETSKIPLHPLLVPHSASSLPAVDRNSGTTRGSVVSSGDFFTSTSTRPPLTSSKTDDPRDPMNAPVSPKTVQGADFSTAGAGVGVGVGAGGMHMRDQIMNRITQLQGKIQTLEDREALLLSFTSQEHNLADSSAASVDLSKTYYDWRSDIATELSHISASLRKSIEPAAAKVTRKNELKADELLLDKLWTTNMRDYRGSVDSPPNLDFLDQWARCSSWVSRIVVERQKLQAMVRTLERQLETTHFDLEPLSAGKATTPVYLNSDERLQSSAYLPVQTSPTATFPFPQPTYGSVVNQVPANSLLGTASPAILIAVLIPVMLLIRSEDTITNTINSWFQMLISLLVFALSVFGIVVVIFVGRRLYLRGSLDFLWSLSSAPKELEMKHAIPGVGFTGISETAVPGYAKSEPLVPLDVNAEPFFREDPAGKTSHYSRTGSPNLTLDLPSEQGYMMNNISSPRSSVFSPTSTPANLGPWAEERHRNAHEPSIINNDPVSPIHEEPAAPVSQNRSWTWGALPPMPTLHDERGVPVADKRSFRPYMLGRFNNKSKLKASSAANGNTEGKSQHELEGFVDENSFKPYGPPPNRYKSALT